MKDLLWLIRKTMQTTFRKKSSWMTYFLLPLAGVFLALLFYGTQSGGPLRVGIVNNDPDQTITEDTIQMLVGMGKVEVTMTDQAELDKQLGEGKLDSGVIFNQGFGESVRSGAPQGISISSVKGAGVTAYLKSMLMDDIGNIAAIGMETKGDDAAFDRIYDSFRGQSFSVSAVTVEDTSSVKDVTYQSIGFLITFMMFSAVNLADLILREKENRTFLRLLSSPVSARTYVLSNVSVSFIIMVLQIAVTLFVMKIVLGIDSGVSYSLLAPVLVLFSLTAIGLSLMIVSLAKNKASASAMQNLIITPSCLLAGCFFPMEIMPDSVRKISSFMPQHWLLDTVNQLQYGKGISELYLNLIILLAFAAAFSLVAVYRFSRNNDTRMFV
ncbi:ABC transporter permease [Paenibacillus sp. HB172176]|uniref:ABC transporter permease n=1 Tax=Paenibacillus sp. HB172176 TaxID=2493690 RepID=UPI00143BD816|nr:ABC transporter permease [Paenibacillus sp. HB172176]